MEDSGEGRRVPWWRLPRVVIVIGASSAAAYEVPSIGRPFASCFALRALPGTLDEEWRAGLAALLREIRSGGMRSADIVLLRPFTIVRALRLPRLRRGVLHSLVDRGAERWFPFAAGAVEVTRLSRVREGGPTAVASAVDAEVLSAVWESAVEEGVQVSSMGAGVHAAVAGALRVNRRLTRDRHRLAFVFAHETVSVVVGGGEVEEVRSLPWPVGGVQSSRADQLASLVEAHPETPAVHTFGPASNDSSASFHPGSHTGHSAPFRSAEALAALGATLGRMRRHDLRRPEHWMAEHIAALRRTVLLAAAAVVVAATGAGIRLRRVEADADRVMHARETLLPAVQAMLRARRDMDAVRARVMALDSLERARPRWVLFFARFAESLPADAYIETLRADEGGVEVEGLAVSASSVVLDLERRGWTSVRITAPLQREETAGGERERFAVRFEAPAYHLGPQGFTEAAAAPRTTGRAEAP